MKDIKFMLLGLVLSIAGCFFTFSSSAMDKFFFPQGPGIMFEVFFLLGGILLLAGVALCVVGFILKHNDK